MLGDVEKEHRSEQVSKTFALLTAKLEDAAELAAHGQGSRADATLVDIAQKIEMLASEAATIAGTLAALLRHRQNLT